MKVWGSTEVVGNAVPLPGQPKHNTQARVIVCARSQKRAVELLDCTVRGPRSVAAFRAWWGETHNPIELATAAGNEGVWYAPLDGPHRSEFELWPGLRKETT